MCYNEIGDDMILAIGNDHKGYLLKQQILSVLKEKYELIDVGTNSEESVDYPYYAKKVSEVVSSNQATFGILICGTGIGMSIAANKIKGIRCAKVSNQEEAYFTRADNDANVLALSYKLELEEALRIIQTFVETATSLEERHVRRRMMIKEFENES